MTQSQVRASRPYDTLFYGRMFVCARVCVCVYLTYMETGPGLKTALTAPTTPGLRGTSPLQLYTIPISSMRAFSPCFPFWYLSRLHYHSVSRSLNQQMDNKKLLETL